MKFGTNIMPLEV